MKRIPIGFWLAGALCGCALITSGCAREEPEQEQAKLVLPSQRQKTTRVRLMPEQTGEYARQFLPGKDNRVRKVLIIFRDGCRGELRLDGTSSDQRPLRTAAVEHHVDGSSTHYTFSANGKEVISALTCGKSKERRSASETLSDGVKRFTLYQQDGQKPELIEQTDKDSQVQRTLFRADGKTPRAELKADTSLTRVELTLFDEAGLPSYSEKLGPYEETGSNETVVTVFSAGKPLFRQRWLQSMGGGEEGEQQPELQWVEEYYPDGTTVQRRITPTFLDDKGTAGFAVERFSPAGKSLGSKNVTDLSAEGVAADRLQEISSKQAEALAPRLMQPAQAKQHDHLASYLPSGH